MVIMGLPWCWMLSLYAKEVVGLGGMGIDNPAQTEYWPSKYLCQVGFNRERPAVVERMNESADTERVVLRG